MAIHKSLISSIKSAITS